MAGISSTIIYNFIFEQAEWSAALDGSTLLEQQGTPTPLGMKPYAILADTLTLLSSLVRKGYARIVRRMNEKEKS